MAKRKSNKLALVPPAAPPTPQIPAGQVRNIPMPDFGPVIGPPRPWIVAPAHNNMLYTSYVYSVWEYLKAYRENLGSYPVVDWIGQESCVPRARNNFAAQALLHPNPPTHLVFIDTDVSFIAQELHDLLLSNLPIVVGGYPKKGYDWQKALDAVRSGQVQTAEQLELIGTDPVCNFFEEDQKNQSIPSVFPFKNPDGTPDMTKRFMICKEAGTGMMVIRTEVIRKMVQNYPQRRYICNDNSGPGQERFNLFSNEVDPYPYDPTCPQFITEDYNFSRLAARIGIPTFVYDKMMLGHQGNFIFKGQMSRKFANATMSAPIVQSLIPKAV